jgi:glutathione peroxidase
MIRFMLVCLLATSGWLHADDPKGTTVTGPLAFKVKSIDNQDVDLSTYKGKVVLFVNVASQCGYTPQYEGLQKLHETYMKSGFTVIGVPANNFGAQEPGSNDEIAKFCKTNYKVTFPMLSKISVKGDDIAPLYKHLTDKDSNPGFEGDVKWNFEKFLIGKDGKVCARFKSGVEPMGEELTTAVKKALEAK